MPTVPYSPVPDVAPIHGGPGGIRTSVPSGAFGENVGDALGRLGKAISGAGEEMVSRAIAFQQLRNETEARDADTEYVMQVGAKHAEYQSLQGKAAVDAYPDYARSLRTLRTEIRDRMSNSASQRMFDSQSMGTMSRTIFSGASHSATQNKRWAIGSAGARITAAGDEALSQPQDDQAFEDSLSVVRGSVMIQGDLAGWDETQINQETNSQVSTLWAKRIEGLSRTEPMRAQKMLDKAAKEGGLRGEQIAKTTAIVTRQLQTVGARQISANVNSGADLEWGASPVPIAQARDAVGERESGGDYSVEGIEVFDRKTGASRGRALGKYQVMPENLSAWLKEAGLPQMTPKQFLANKGAQDQVFDTVFGRYMKEHGSFNEAVSMWFTGTTLKQAIAEGRHDKQTSIQEYLKSTNAILARNKPLSEKVERGRAIADATSTDPTFADFVVQRISTDYDKVIKVRRDDAWNNKQTIEEGLMGGTTGKLPTTVEELWSNGPQIEQAWNDLDPSVRRSYMKVLAQNVQGDVTWDVGGTRLREWQRLRGMATSDQAAFLDTNIMETDLPQSAKRELIKLQQNVKNQAGADPRTTVAMRSLLPMLGPADLATRTNANKDRYDQFVGALQDGMKDFQEREKRPPKLEDIQLIGARLLQEQGRSWYHSIVGAPDRMFETKIPADELEKTRVELQSKYPGLTVSDEEINRAYVRKQYQQLYGKTKSTPAGPQVPK